MRQVEGGGEGGAGLLRSVEVTSQTAAEPSGDAKELLLNTLLLQAAEYADAEGRGSDEVCDVLTTMEDAKVVDPKWTCTSR
jgi:hypothetical protein